MTGPGIKLAAAALLGAALVASGCGSSGDVDLARGRSLFITKCGVCHALNQAATSAEVGPNLDAAFAAARNSGQDADTIKGVTSAQIEHPRETDPSDPTYMPADLVTGQDAEDVAAYVGSVAGVPGIGPPTVPGGPGAQVFANNGCGACHTLASAGTAGNVGPNLDNNLPGQSEDMIRTSIVNPSALLVSGFDNLMPANYGESIDPADLDLLVKYLAACAGNEGPNAGGSSTGAASGPDGGGSGGSTGGGSKSSVDCG